MNEFPLLECLAVQSTARRVMIFSVSNALRNEECSHSIAAQRVPSCRGDVRKFGYPNIHPSAFSDDRRATVFQVSLPLVVPVMSLDQALEQSNHQLSFRPLLPSHLDNLLHTAL